LRLADQAHQKSAASTTQEAAGANNPAKQARDTAMNSIRNLKG
jgi:hypothetical protein